MHPNIVFVLFYLLRHQCSLLLCLVLLWFLWMILSEFSTFFLRRVNPYGLPIITSMFSIAQRLLNAKYYGYINFDILVDPMIFDILSFCENSVKSGQIKPMVPLFYPSRWHLAWDRWPCLWAKLERPSVLFRLFWHPPLLFCKLHSQQSPHPISRKCRSLFSSFSNPF